MLLSAASSWLETTDTGTGAAGAAGAAGTELSADTEEDLRGIVCCIHNITR